MLLVDGVKYELWTPPSEDAFEQVVKKHALDIFSENSIYLDTKQKLKSKAGIGSIPDGYAIVFNNPPSWHIVEIELSNHPIYDHVVTQISKFINGVKNHSTQKEIVNIIYGLIDEDDYLKLKVGKAIGHSETYKFLSELISKPPDLTIIIEQRTETLDEALSCLANIRFHVVEFRTFTRQGCDLSVRAHVFEPIYRVPIHPPPPMIEPKSITTNILEIIVKKNDTKYFRFNLGKNPDISMFPPLDPGINTRGETKHSSKFVIKTPYGDCEKVYISQRKYNTQIRGLDKLKGHNELEGAKLFIEVIEPMRKYRLRKA